jgi:hypothetical protein
MNKSISHTNSKGILYRWPVLAFCSFVAANCNAATLVTPDMTIMGLTHTFGHFAPAGPTTSISDSVAAGQFTQTGFTTTLTGSELVVSHFEAAPGKKFVIHTPPAGFGNITLTVIGEWLAGSDFGITPVSNSAIFENLVGSAPVLISSQNVIGAGGKWVRSYAVFTVAPGTAFTGVQVSAQFASSIANPASQSFMPHGVTFSASVSSSQTLGDGFLLTLESLPIPSIKIKCSGIGFVISWPTNFNNWVLETATQLGSTNNWCTVTNTCVIIGTNFAMTNMCIEPSRYYHLRTP